MKWCLVVLVGCGRIGFGTIGDDGGGHDGIAGDGFVAVGDSFVTIGDGVVSGCIDPGDGDGFDGTTACSNWGSLVMTDATVIQSMSELQITPAPSTLNAEGGCQRTAVPFTAGGLFVEISSTVTVFTQLLYDTDNGSWELGISRSMIVTLQPSDSALLMSAYDPVAMRWLRMRPNGNVVEFETSPDGRTWNQLRTSTDPPPTTGTVTIDAFMRTSTIDPGVAIFEGIDVCPS